TGENPETVFPFVVDDVVDVANCTLREGMDDLPRASLIDRSIDVHRTTIGVVKILAKVDLPVCRRREMQGARAASDRMLNNEFGSVGLKSNDGARNRRHQISGRKYHQRMKAIPA